MGHQSNGARVVRKSRIFFDFFIPPAPSSLLPEAAKRQVDPAPLPEHRRLSTPPPPVYFCASTWTIDPRASPCGAPRLAFRGPLGAHRGPARQGSGGSGGWGSGPWRPLACLSHACLARHGSLLEAFVCLATRDGGEVSSRAGPSRAWECESRPAPTRGLGQVVECPAPARRQGLGLIVDCAGPPKSCQRCR